MSPLLSVHDVHVKRNKHRTASEEDFDMSSWIAFRSARPLGCGPYRAPHHHRSQRVRKGGEQWTCVTPRRSGSSSTRVVSVEVHQPHARSCDLPAERCVRAAALCVRRCPLRSLHGTRQPPRSAAHDHGPQLVRYEGSYRTLPAAFDDARACWSIVSLQGPPPEGLLRVGGAVLRRPRLRPWSRWGVREFASRLSSRAGT